MLIPLVLALVLLGISARGAGPLPGDLAATRILQGLPAGGPAGLVLFYAGDAAWFLPAVAVAAALLARRWAVASWLLLVSAVAVPFGDGLKRLVGRPRPPAELVARYDVVEGYGFPSGTALLTAAALGLCCYLLLRYRAPRPVAIVAILASVAAGLAVGLSRVYVGEHWASDVLGGWLAGGALVVCAALALRPRRLDEKGGR